MKNRKRLSQLGEKHIVNLLLETKAYDVLAGQISTDGSRTPNGTLDLHFPPQGVSELLSVAGGRCYREGDTSGSVELLSLAGKYSDVLSILNRTLASLIVVTNEESVDGS